MKFIKLIKSKIVKKDNKYQVQSEKGKNLGTYDSKEEAEKRLRQVEYFKHKKSAKTTKTKKTSPKVKKIVKKPTKTTKKTKNTSRRFKIKPNKVLKKKPNNTIKPSKKVPKSQNKPVSKRYKIRTTTSEWPHQDISTSTFEELLDQGYNMATFVAYPNACKFCQKLNGKTWTLQNFLDTTEYDAPIFSHSHVNAFSEIKVWDKNGELPDVYVNYEGNIR